MVLQAISMENLHKNVKKVSIIMHGKTEAGKKDKTE